MRTDLRATAALAALLASAAGAEAQGYVNAPFRDAPVALAQAAALERIEIYARAIAAAGVDADDDDDDDDDDEEEEGGPLFDFSLVRGSLATAAPELERGLAAEIGELAEGEADAAEEILPLVERAKAALLVPETADAAPFQAGVMAALLLEEGGVAEGYEEAVEGEATAYAVGYFALQRVKALWEGLAGQASAEQAEDVGEMFAILDGLFPGEAMPETLSPDPEQAEAPAQQLVGLLEAVTNADLYPGRDLGAAAARVHDIAAEGCEAFAAGDAGVGLERLTIAAAYYDQTVADTLGLLAPESAEAIDDHLEAVEEGEADEAAAACAPLLDALAAGREALMP